MTKRSMRECPGCGARTPSADRRCRICTRVINHTVHEPDRGLAALHPDVGFGTTFTASWDPRTAGLDGDPDLPTDGPAIDAAGGTDGGVDPSVVAPAAPRWVSLPIELSVPLWEPTRDGRDDESVDLATTIVLDAPLRNGATPPPLVYETEHFDPDALERDPVGWLPGGPGPSTVDSPPGMGEDRAVAARGQGPGGASAPWTTCGARTRTLDPWEDR